MDKHRYSKENAIGNTYSQARNISIGGRIVGFFRIALPERQFQLVLLVLLVCQCRICGSIHGEIKDLHDSCRSGE